MYFEITDSQKEVTKHVTDNLPLAIYHRILNKQQQDRLMPHWHQEFQFVWILEGTLSYSIETSTITLSASSGILINSSKLHSAKPISDNVEYICIDFSPFFINTSFYQNVISAIQQDPMFHFIPIQLTTQQESIVRETVFSKINYLTLYELLLSMLSQVQTEAGTFKKSQSDIYHLLDFVHTHYQQPLSVDDIAQSIPINKNKCTTLFKQYTKLSPINYLIDFRLNKAKELLQTTNHSISEICYFVGFNNISYFITKFKQKYNCTPLKFRKHFRS
ncbi:helix-turn-helix transcriptional regulator [Enterococcus saccharolyticus]|uniref:HTH araC/xylS-type domain-containing protein n=1 Tax=Enterococcus saccharolyticus subsp. saccharolyticus ATCC 43076 TaxID=1139996 RepID=S0JH89_9ENTE|nr:AraC family transcriptional regulator [Enterococcus saccharolyticus]EOT27900.1 hypothetical protein OMQ_01814 [Enterococcus saccharolyticus subsp. saccharolyticus ATCC 43076]EOT77278.1 hypothetical protein I572_02190 [Enterococcus saccharolyticus subsp. saccharolyticus ATCC 43076]OJG87406.1 hypothetical protein RV16_GL000688 [Enterococcus saccharolyticus]